MGHVFHDGSDGVLPSLFLFTLKLLASYGIQVRLLYTRLCRIGNLYGRFLKFLKQGFL